MPRQGNMSSLGHEERVLQREIAWRLYGGKNAPATRLNDAARSTRLRKQGTQPLLEDLLARGDF